MNTKLITGTVLLILSIVVSQSMAADQENAKANALEQKFQVLETQSPLKTRGMRRSAGRTSKY